MKKRLLIVDDSRFVYEEMKFMLENTDYEIVGYAKSGEEALEIFEGIMPDLVTMDIILPGMDGMDAAELLLKKWPGTGIVVVSSLAYDETIDRAKCIGAKDFLFKPFVKEQLLNSLAMAHKED